MLEVRRDLAERVFDAGLDATQDTPAGLAAAFARTLAALPEAELRAFLGGHPDLGEAAVRAAALTPDSRGEQASAGLDRLDAATLAYLRAENTRWRSHYGFPFILAVRGLTADAILAAYAARRDNPPDVERAEALRQIERILVLRIADRSGGDPPAT